MHAQADPIVASLSREEALERTRSGGTVLCLGGVPTGVEFGIDLRSYTVGPRFGGIKMVPASGGNSMHLVTWGTDLATCGTFIAFEQPSDVSVLRWDAHAESLRVLANGDESERQTIAVQRMEHDASLGPYPLATAAQWWSLCNHVSTGVLRRAAIPPGTLIAPGGVDEAAFEEELERARKQMQAEQPSSELPSLKPQARPAPATTAQQPTSHMQDDGDDGDDDAATPTPATFVELDPRRSGRGRSGADLSRFHLDKSEWLTQLLAEDYGGAAVTDGGGEAAAAASESDLLGELQLSYLLFLRLASLRALEQWKSLVHLLLSCEEALRTRPSLYLRLLPILRAQLTLAPADFFESELSEDNFLRDTLATLAELTSGPPLGGGAHAAPSLAPELSAELGRLWDFMGSQFGLSLDALCASALDEDDAPVVVAGDGCEY